MNIIKHGIAVCIIESKDSPSYYQQTTICHRSPIDGWYYSRQISFVEISKKEAIKIIDELRLRKIETDTLFIYEPIPLFKQSIKIGMGSKPNTTQAKLQPHSIDDLPF